MVTLHREGFGSVCEAKSKICLKVMVDCRYGIDSVSNPADILSRGA